MADDDILSGSSTETAMSFLEAADDVEIIVGALAADLERWGEEYAAALRRKAYALSS